mgnify:CR=1 FL=1
MLIDILTYAINGDTKGLEKCLQDSEKGVDKLGKKMTEAEKAGEQMAAKIGDGLKNIGLAAAAAFAVRALSSMVSQFADVGDTIGDFAEMNGEAVEDVDAFSRSIQGLGGTMEGALGSMQKVSMKIGQELKEGVKDGEKGFASLGIALEDSSGKARGTLDVLAELSGKLEGMSRQEALYNLRSMGIRDQETLELMLKGRQEFTRIMALQKASSIMTKESTELAGKYKDSQNKLKDEMSQFAGKIALKLLPALIWMKEKFASVYGFLNRHSPLVSAALVGIAGVITALLIPAAAGAAAALWAMLGPIIAIAAPLLIAGALLVLMYDDIANFMEGNDSLMGDLLNSSESLKAIYDYLRDSMASLFELIAAGWDLASAGTGALVDKMRGMIVWVLELSKAVRESLIDALSGFLTFGVGVFQTMVDWVSRLLDKVQALREGLTGKIVAGVEFVAEGLGKAKGALGGAAANQLNSTTSNAISNMTNSTTQTSVAVGQVTVNTQATDASGIAQGVGGALKDQLRSVQNSAATGVAR